LNLPDLLEHVGSSSTLAGFRDLRSILKLSSVNVIRSHPPPFTSGITTGLPMGSIRAEYRYLVTEAP